MTGSMFQINAVHLTFFDSQALGLIITEMEPYLDFVERRRGAAYATYM